MATEGNNTTRRSIACHKCGQRNRVPVRAGRCENCGARLSTPADASRANRPARVFSFSWLLFGLVLTGVFTGAILVGLPRLVYELDFEGSAGIFAAIPVWFCCGLLLGLMAPSPVLYEATLAAALIAIPTIVFLHQGQTVKTLPTFMYILLAALGVLFALLGAHAGEHAQNGSQSKARDGST